MKIWSISALLLALLVTACGEKEATEAAESEAAPATEAAAPAAEAAAPAEVAPAGPGGYEPKPEERVPGITMTKEEVEKMVAEGLADTPKPIIPGEAAPAPEAPAEAAPAETAK